MMRVNIILHEEQFIWK